MELVFRPRRLRRTAHTALRMSQATCRCIQNAASLRIHGFDGAEEGRLNHDQLPVTWKAWDKRGRPISFDGWPVTLSPIECLVTVPDSAPAPADLGPLVKVETVTA